jgi:hypothetical protein
VGVAGYKVYKNGVQINAVSANSYAVTGLSGGTAYGFTVAAYDVAGNVSSQSASVSATTQQIISCTANPCVASPASGATAASPVHFTASGKSSYPISAWAVYDDAAHGYALLGKWSGTSLNQYVTIKSGTHSGVVVQFWDGAGVIRKTAVSFTAL